MSITTDKRKEVLATNLRFIDESLIVDLADGRTVTVSLSLYPRLVHATKQERENWEMLFDGEGFHWPDLDEDLSVYAFVNGLPSAEGKRSFARWLKAKQEGRGLTVPELRAYEEAKSNGNLLRSSEHQPAPT